MKKKSINKKLSINKQTISHLDLLEQKSAKAGFTTLTEDPFNCPQSNVWQYCETVEHSGCWDYTGCAYRTCL